MKNSHQKINQYSTMKSLQQLLIAFVILLISQVSNAQVYYSYQSGDWNQVSTWTHDPGGTTHTASDLPGNADSVVILTSRTVLLPSDIASTGLNITIHSGAFLDMATHTFTSGLNFLDGQGTLQLASVSYPTVTTNLFNANGGGTTEYNVGADFTLPASQAVYNHLVINSPGFIATQRTDLMLNGDLTVSGGTYRINDNSSTTALSLTVNGDVSVAAGAAVRVGEGATNVVDDPMHWGHDGGTAPYLNYYRRFHTINLYGNFINNGTVRFTNLNYPVYNLFPPTVSGTTAGAASVYFFGASDNSLTCNGATDFYNLIVDKGVDQSFKLNIYSSAYTNFRIFGANNAEYQNAGANPDVRKALWIRTGTVVLDGLIVIPSLSEANPFNPGNETSNYIIPSNGALQIDGPNVAVFTTADDYQEINAAYGVAAPDNGTIGITSGLNSAVSVYGKIEVNDGYLSAKESSGFVVFDFVSGEFELNGGVVDAKQYRASTGATGHSSYIQTGGLFELRGRFQRTPAAYSGVNDLINAPINLDRVLSGMNPGLGVFNINSADNVFNMSGGTIRIYDVGDAAGEAAIEINSSEANTNVLGGQFELIPTTGNILGDALFWEIASTAPLGNLLIDRASSTSEVRLRSELLIYNDLVLRSGDLNAINNDLTVGGNFTIDGGTTYTPGTNTTIFTGEGDQQFTINLAAPLTLNKLKIEKDDEDIVQLSGSQTVLNIPDSLFILDGIFDDGGYTVNLSGNVYNSGTHTGTGSLVFSGDNTHNIDGGGIFSNIELTRTTAGTDYVISETDITLNGSLTFSGVAGANKLLDIQRFDISITANASITGADASRYIVVDGEIGGGSITKTYSATSTSFTFPMGGTSYTPGTISLGAAPTTYGDVSVSIGSFEHPTVTATGQNLTYFWRVRESGFTGIPAGSVTHTFTYADADIAGTETNYLPARYDWTTYTWTSGTTASVDEGTNTIGDPWLTNTNNIFGDYTAGEAGSFDGVTTYYSIGDGLWGNTAVWSTVGHAGPSAGTVPGIGDAVVIGDNDSIWLDNTNNTAANEDPRTCASLQIEAGAALDITYNPASDFGMVLNHPNGNGNFRLTTSFTSGSTFAFPSGDFSDFNENLGTTELYSINTTSGTTYWLPNGVFEYGNLIMSPEGGSKIIFPNNDVTIYGDIVVRGFSSDSWICMTWTGDYPTIPFVRLSKTITIYGNMDLQKGSFIWNSGSNGTGGEQHVIIHGDVTVSANSAIDVWNSHVSQSMKIGGSIINNTNGVTDTYGTISHIDFSNQCPVTFFGDTDASITTSTGVTPVTIFSDVTVDKGSDQSTTILIDVPGTFTTPTDDWFTLENGTFHYNRAGDFNISQGSAFTIPSTSSLTVETDDNVLIGNSAVDNNDLFLHGNLTIIRGNVYVGPIAAPNSNNDIEYSGSGSSEIDIWGGNLTVNGQVRRNPSTTAGILNYHMSGGSLTVNGNNAITTRAKLEILNSGSDFTMSAGTINILHGGGGNTYGDLYLRPDVSNVTGGEIIFSSVGNGADQDYLLDANIMLNNLTVTGGAGEIATLELLISPLGVDGNITISNSNSIFDANANFDIDVSLNGNLTNNGIYNAQNNLTTFSGDTQSITGSSVTTFYNLNVNPATSLTLGQDVNVNNDLDLMSGSLNCVDYTVTLLGDLYNDADYTDNSTGIVLNGTSEQHISGSGIYGQLELDNTQGARLNNDVTLTSDLVLTNGILDINRYILTLGQTSNIFGAPFSDKKMITTDGVYSNVGIQKEFTAGATTFEYPIGTAGKYTPADLTVTANATPGYVRINNINRAHPSTIDSANILGYYWEVTSGGLSGFDGNLVFNYLQEDVRGVQESSYIAARLLIPGTSWSESLTIDDAANTATFNYTGTDNLSGEYTAGISGAFPPDIPEFTTNTSGVWSDCSIWTQTGGTPIACPTGGPNGFILVINDTVITDANYATAYQTTINGRLEATGGYYGHNIGNVYGSGTLYLENATIPAGRYTNFLSCGGNGTLEYGGNGSYTIIADLYDTLAGLVFSGTGTRILPDKDLTICNQLIIDGPTLDNSVNNRGLNIMGTFERYYTGVFTSGSGANATVRFTGLAPQTLGGATGDFTGTSAFNNFEINNSSRLTLNTGANIEVNGDLLLTDGIIYTFATENLTVTNTSKNAVVPVGGSTSSYVSGPLTKRINQGDEFLFPIGQDTYIGNKLMLEATQTGTLDWTVEYIRPNPDVTFNAPLTLVNPDEYWTVSSTAGSEAVINIAWDPSSGLTPAITQNGPADMRVAVYDGTDWNAILSTSTGDNDNGTVETDDRQTLTTGTDEFTTAVVNTTAPLARFVPTGSVCGTAGIPIEFIASGAIPTDYTLDYTITGVPQATITITAGDLPYTLPTPSAGTYQLTNFTYNTGGGTGIVSNVTVDVYTDPTVSAAGPDQQLCGATQAILAANAPVVGTGQWYFVTGTGGSLVDPANNGTTINGTSGTTYELEWVIANGTCESRDTVEIDFPMNPDLSTFTAPVICSGATYDLANVVIIDANFTEAVYTYHSESPALPGNVLGSQVVAPTADSTYYILGATPSGCTDELPVTITVNPSPALSTITTPVICFGDTYDLISVTLDDANTTGATYTYHSESPALPANELASTTVEPTADSTYYFLATTVFGCTDELAVTVTVNLLPTPGLTSSDADNIICAGETVVFTAMGGIGYDFVLNNVVVQSGATATYSTSSLANDDSIKVIVTNTNSCVDSSAAITTTVNILPLPGLTSSDADDVICAGEIVVFSATGGMSYDFVLNNVVVQSGATDTYSTSSLANTDSIKVIVTNANGCVDSSAAITTTVNALPLPVLTSSDADNIICAGETVVFTATGGISYDFVLNNVVVQSGTTDTYSTSSLFNNDSIKVIVTNTNNCIDSSAAITTAVNTLPLPGLTSSDADNIICAGETVVFTATGGISYDFVLNNVVVQSGATDIYSNSSLFNNDSIKVIVTKTNNCIDSSAAITTTVNTLPLPGLTSSDADNIICTGETVVFTATGGIGYDFVLNNVFVQSGATDTYSTSSLANDDSIKVIVTNTNSCVDSSAAITTTVNALPLPGLTSSDADNIICAGETVVFTATGGVSYNFVLNNVFVQSGATDTYSTSSLFNNDSIKVIVTNGNSCVDSSAAITSTINALPTPGLTSSDADNVICAGETVVFTATGGVSYDFVLNNVVVQSGATDTYSTSSLFNNDSIKVIVTNVSSCTDSSATITTTVNVLPTVSITSSNAGLCVGDNVSLTGSPTGGTFTILGSSTGTGTIGIGDVLTATGNGVLDIEYYYTDGKGCSNTDIQHIDVSDVGAGDAGIITGDTNVCQGITGVTYSVPDISYADNYIWNYSGTDVTIVGTGKSVTLNFGASATSGDLSVYGENECGFGASSLLSINVSSSAPGAVGPITGSNAICPVVTGEPYSIPVIAGATNYVWNYTGTGATINGIGNAITVDFTVGATNGDLTVYAENSCGTGSPGSLSINVTAGPDDAGTIAGSIENCANTSADYSVPLINNADEYIWSYTGSDVTILGVGNTVTLNFGPDATSGDLIVFGRNTCGDGNPSAPLSITINTVPEALGTITGETNICAGITSETYSVASVSGANAYLWNFRNTGATPLNNDTTSSSIDLDFGENAISGVISVAAVNVCGTGSNSPELSVSVEYVPESLNSIEGPTEVCQGQNNVLYRVDSLDNADSYTWSYDGFGATINDVLWIASIEFDLSAETGALTVYASNSCGNGGVSEELNILMKSANECASSFIEDVTNTFTPNGDGHHDFWKINGIDAFPNAKVEVFDRWGRRVYLNEHYSNENPWDGTVNGKQLPYDNYFYVLDLHGNGKVVLRGNLTIVR
jgi:gliding motility-associated-like protein